MKYNIRKNNLTVPPSYKPQAVISAVLNKADIANLINVKNPETPSSEIEGVLDTLRQVCLEQISSGNAITIKNFLSLRPAVKGVIEEGLLTCETCKARITIAPKLKADAKLKATFSFSGDTIEGKTSSGTAIAGTGTVNSCGIVTGQVTDINVTAQAKIIEVKSSFLNVNNHIHEGYGLIVTGENLRYNPDIPDSGVWIKSANNTSRLQDNVMVTEPKKSIVVGDVDFIGGPAGQNSVEHSLRLARINTKGVQQDTIYNHPVRKTNYVDNSNPNIFLIQDQSGGVAEIVSQGIPEQIIQIVSTIKNGSVYLQAIKGDQSGTNILVGSNGVYVLDVPNEGTIEVEVKDLDILESNVKSYGNYMNEVVNLGIASLEILPSTGLVTCYDAAGLVISCSGSGQDGEYQAGVSLPQPRFTDNLDGTLTDNLTGLVWLRETDIAGLGQNLTSDQALALALTVQDGVLGLTDGSSPGDWVLPNITQLNSLCDFSLGAPCLPNMEGTDGNGSSGTESFYNVESDIYISSSSVSFDKIYTWALFMGDGGVTYSDKSSTTKAMLVKRQEGSGLVRTLSTGLTSCYDSNGLVISCTGTGQDADVNAGIPIPAQRFTDNGDGTVTDNMTGVIWSSNADQTTGEVNWEQSLVAANAIPGFRLPNINELYSLVDFRIHSPSFDNSSGYFLNFTDDTYWSSTTLKISGIENRAWAVSFFAGELFFSSKTNTAKVLLVKE